MTAKETSGLRSALSSPPERGDGIPVILRTATVFVALALCASPLRAAPTELSITTLILEGNNIPGLGQVTAIKGVEFGRSGEWTIHLEIDDGGGTRRSLLLDSERLLVAEGSPVSQPPGATVRSISSFDVSCDPGRAWIVSLDGTSGPSDDSGLYFENALVIQEGSLSTAPELAGSSYRGFETLRISSGGRVVFVASVQDPAMTSGRALVLASVDSGGTLIGESSRLRSGSTLPGQVDSLRDLDRGPHSVSIDHLGSVLVAAQLDVEVAFDEIVVLDGEIIAREGFPAPVTGRSWEKLAESRVDLAGPAGHVFSGVLDGNDEVIVRNGTAAVMTGDSPVDIAPFTITGLGNDTPVLIDSLGEVLWYGQWNDPDASLDTGLFLDGNLLVQEGQTTVDGRSVSILPDRARAFAISPDGSEILFRAIVDGNRDGVFLLTRPVPYAVEAPDPGQAGQENTLRVTGACPGARTFFVAGIRRGNRAIPGCSGLSLGIEVDPANRSRHLLGAATGDCLGEAELVSRFPGQASGRTVFFQAVEASTCRVTDVVEFTFP